MTDAIEQVDQAMLGTIKRNAGLGFALGIAIAIAGVLAIISPGQGLLMFLLGVVTAIAGGYLVYGLGLWRSPQNGQ